VLSLSLAPGKKKAGEENGLFLMGQRNIERNRGSPRQVQYILFRDRFELGFRRTAERV